MFQYSYRRERPAAPRKATNMAPKHYLMMKETAKRTKKPTKSQIEKLNHALALSRVRRPDLEAAIASGKVHALKRVPAAIVKNAALRKRDYSGPEYVYQLTEADMGRAKSSAETQAMSIYQWLIKYHVAVGILHRDEIAIVVVKDDDTE